jgi:hypothetical protein
VWPLLLEQLFCDWMKTKAANNQVQEPAVPWGGRTLLYPEIPRLT